jgi:branched-subunit amino acid transport protein
MAGMGIATFGTRLSFLVFVHHDRLPAAVRQALRYVAPAVLAAILLPAVLYRNGTGGFDVWLTNERVPAALVAVAVAWVTSNVWATIAAGMAALWLLQWAL